MNHEEVEDRNVAERYVLRRLVQEEVSVFEEHLLECSECAARVEACEGLRAGLRAIAADEASRVPAAPLETRRTAGPWPPRAWPHAAAMAGIALVLAGLPSGVLLYRLEATRRERDAARLETAAAERRLAEEARAPESGRAARTEEALPTPSPVAAPVFVLPLTRGAEAFPADAMRVPIHDGDQWVVLALESEAAAAYRTCRVELATEEGRDVWGQDGVRSAPPGMVALSVPARRLEPGGYVVSLLGLASNGRLTPLGRYPFRVLRER
jgi:hypothetical protein